MSVKIMETALVKIRTEKFYATFDDFTYKEFASLDSALKSESKYVIKELWGQRDDADNRLTGFEYTIFDHNGNECILVNNNWKSDNLTLSSGSGVDVYNKSNVNFDITDPRNNKRKMNFGEGIKGLVEGLKFLAEAGSLANWSHYDTIQENSALKKKVKELERKLEAIKRSM